MLDVELSRTILKAADKATLTNLNVPPMWGGILTILSGVVSCYVRAVPTVASGV